MSNTAMIEKSRQGKRRAVEKIFERYPINEEFVTSDGELADKLRLPKQDVQNARYDLVEIKSLQATKTQINGRGRAGWQTAWTLIETKNVTLARLEAKWKRDDEHTAELMRQPNKFKNKNRLKVPANGVDLGTATPEHPVVPDELVASAGPVATPQQAPALAPARYDESAALIEAARQYANTNNQLEAKVKELEALGVQVDRAALAKAIKAPHDHRLLVVSMVLPYIDRIERERDRHVATITDLREKLADMPSLRDGNRRLSEQNQRLVSQLAELRSARANGTAPAPAPKAAAPVG